MAGLGDFLQGFSQAVRPLPNIIQQNQAELLKMVALDRQERQLEQQIKKAEIATAQENFFKGVQLLPTLSDDMAPALVKTVIAPAIDTLNKYGVTGYGQEEAQGFLSKLQENPTAAKAVAKDINALIKSAVYKGEDGRINYPALLKDMKLVINQHAVKLNEAQKKTFDAIVQDVAMEGLGQTKDEAARQYLAGHLTKEQQKAYGIGEQPKNVTKYTDFAIGYKAKLRALHPDWSEEQIALATAEEADRRGLEQQKQVISLRIPPYQQAQDLPPGYTFNRKTGKFVAPDGSEVTPQEFADLFTQKAGLTAGKSSLTNQQKVYDMMGSFVNNMTEQIDRVEDIHKDIAKRVGVRALDMPIRELKKRFAGSGNEAILEAYMIEISNEIGKLSTGSSASIRELSVDAQKRWEKIHDPNLSFNELMKILKETKHMARMRMRGAEKQIESTKQRMRGGGQAETTQESNDPLGIR